MVSTGAGLPVSARPVAVALNATSVPSLRDRRLAREPVADDADEVDLVAADRGDEDVALAGVDGPRGCSATLSKATTSPLAEIAEK